MTLAQNPADIRIGDVVLAMERMTIEDERQAHGGFNDIFDVALDAFVSVLNQHTLADVVRSKRSGPLAGLSGKQAKPKGQKAKRKAGAILDSVRKQTAPASKTRGISK
jgi:Rrf2 family nitric oxide-sensitive transcriptional repressor